MATTDNANGNGAKASKHIPAKIYEKWVKPNMIAVCTDALVIDNKGSLVLGIRDIEPVKGLAWIIGGRVPNGMAMEPAVRKKVLQETGLDVAVAGLAGIYRRVYEKGEKRDDLVFTYVAVATGGELRQDFQHSRYISISGYGTEFDSLHERVRQPIVDSSIFEKRGSSTVAQLLREAADSGNGRIDPTYYRMIRDMRTSTPFHDDVTPL